MLQSAPEIIAIVFVNRNRLVIDSLRNLEENRRIFKEKSRHEGGSFYVKWPENRINTALSWTLINNSLY